MLKHIPNILSASRFPLSVLLVFFVNQPLRFLALYVITGLTDFLDGWLARKFHWNTAFGAKLDSFADIFFGLSLLVALLGVLRLYRQIEWYVLAAMGVVGLLKLANLLYTQRKFGLWSSMHTIANKCSSLPFLLIVPLLVFTGEITTCLNITLLLLLSLVFLSNLEESLMLRRMTQFDADAKSLFSLGKKKDDDTKTKQNLGR